MDSGGGASSGARWRGGGGAAAAQDGATVTQDNTVVLEDAGWPLTDVERRGRRSGGCAWKTNRKKIEPSWLYKD
jgi:hypothetical protein